MLSEVLPKPILFHTGSHYIQCHRRETQYTDQLILYTYLLSDTKINILNRFATTVIR